MTHSADALKQAFAGAPSSRTEALRTISLPTREPATRPSDPVAGDHRDAAPDPSDSPPEHVQRPTTKRADAKRSRARPPQPAPAAEPDSDDDQGAARNTIVYVTPRIREALRQQAAREPHVTFTDLVLDALETHEPDLRGCWPARRGSGRFTRATLRHVRRAEPGVQLALRLTTSNLAALDAMVEEFGAPSRTALVEEALCRYFSGDTMSHTTLARPCQ